MTVFSTDGVLFSTNGVVFDVGAALPTYWNGIDATVAALIGTQWGMTGATVTAGTFNAGRAMTQSWAGSKAVSATLPETQALAHGMEWFASMPTSYDEIYNFDVYDQGLKMAFENLGYVTIGGVQHNLWRSYVDAGYDITGRVLKSFELGSGTVGVPVYLWDSDPR